MDIEQIKSALDARDSAIGAKLTKVEQENADLRSRLEEVESKAASPGRTVNTKEQIEQLSNFEAHMQRKAGQAQVITSTPSAGGFAVPEQVAREIEKHELRFSPVRSLVQVQQIGTSDYKHLLNERGATAGWVSEAGARTQTLTPKLREVVPTQGELYALPTATNWSLDDMFFNVQQWLAQEVGEQFAFLEGEAVIRGDGSNKPTGMLNDPPTSRDDFDSPIRDVDEYQFADDGDSPYAVNGDTLISTVYKLNSAYRNGAWWVMNSNTAAVVMKLKDAENRYIWTQSLAMGQPSTLLGYPVAIWEQIDDVSTGAAKFPIAFGNFNRGYLLVDRVGLRIIVDPYSTPGFTRFYVSRRVGGHPLNNDAIKWVKTAA